MQRDVPLVLDVEASGFGAGSYPIEIGVALDQGEAYCALIRPEPDWQHWDNAAEQVHHIARDTLLRHGRPAAEVAAALNARLHGRVVYSDGWAHDYSWLARLFDAADSTPAFRLESLRCLLNDQQASRWHDTKALVAADLQTDRHRASNDARVLQLTLMRVKYGEALPSLRSRSHETRLVEEMAALDHLTLIDHYQRAYGRGDETWLRERHTEVLSRGGRIIAEHLDRRLAGYVLLAPTAPDTWEIAAINIHPWYRRTGLYRRLLTRTLAHLLSHGAHTLTSHVLPGHEVSMRFHEKLGFERASEDATGWRYRIEVPRFAARVGQA